MSKEFFVFGGGEGYFGFGRVFWGGGGGADSISMGAGIFLRDKLPPPPKRAYKISQKLLFSRPGFGHSYCKAAKGVCKKGAVLQLCVCLRLLAYLSSRGSLLREPRLQRVCLRSLFLLKVWESRMGGFQERGLRILCRCCGPHGHNAVLPHASHIVDNPSWHSAIRCLARL